jgi:transketolase
MTSVAPLKTSAMIASFADPGQKTTAAPFGHALVQAARADERIVGMTADLGKYTDMHIFAREYPDRFFQMGMAEQLLFGAAAGMAETGLVPFASTYSVFAARRAYDFICLDIAEPNLNVNVVGGLPGLTTGYGPSHQATEDIAIFRGMPNLTIVDPCDSVDIEQAVPQLAAHAGPTYLRLLRGNVPTVLDEYDYRFELGKAKVLRDGADVVLVSSGLMTMRALQAAEELAAHRVDVAVVHAPTIKPFDAETVLAQVDSDRLVLTCENHTVVGGLFETVASAVVRRGIAKQITPIGLPDEFLAAGALPTLHERYGLSRARIVATVLDRL